MWNNSKCSLQDFEEEKYDDEKEEESRETDSFNTFITSREAKLIKQMKQSNHPK